MGNSAFAFGQRRTNLGAVGTKNGVNDTFTVPGGEVYEPDSLAVFLNGTMYQSASIIENGPGYTTFTITGDTLPVSTDALTVTYTQSS